MGSSEIEGKRGQPDSDPASITDHAFVPGADGQWWRHCGHRDPVTQELCRLGEAAHSTTTLKDEDRR